MILEALQLLMFYFFSGTDSVLRGQTDSKLDEVRLSVGASPPHINFLYLLCQGMKCYFKFWLGFFLMMMRIYGMCSLPLL